MALFCLLVILSGADSVSTFEIERGTLVVAGNVLEPPYVFRASPSDVVINDVSLSALWRLRHPSPPAPDPEMLRKYSARHRLSSSIRSQVESQASHRKSETRSAHAVRLYRASPLVARAWARTSSNEVVYVLWRGDRQPEHLYFSNESSVPANRSGDPPGDTQRYQLESIRSTLERGGMVFIGHGMTHVPAVRVAEVLRQIAALRAGQRRSSLKSLLSADVLEDLLHPVSLDSARVATKSHDPR